MLRHRSRSRSPKCTAPLPTFGGPEGMITYGECRNEGPGVVSNTHPAFLMAAESQACIVWPSFVMIAGITRQVITRPRDAN